MSAQKRDIQPEERFGALYEDYGLRRVFARYMDEAAADTFGGYSADMLRSVSVARSKSAPKKSGGGQPAFQETFLVVINTNGDTVVKSDVNGELKKNEELPPPPVTSSTEPSRPKKSTRWWENI